MAVMSKESANRYSEAIAKRNIEIESAIKFLNRARENAIESDSQFSLYDAEDAIRAARDYNTEAMAIRKAGK